MNGGRAMSMTPVSVKIVKTPSQIVHFSFRKIQARIEVKTGLLSGVSEEQTDNHSRVANKKADSWARRNHSKKVAKAMEWEASGHCANNPSEWGGFAKCLVNRWDAVGIMMIKWDEVINEMWEEREQDED